MRLFEAIGRRPTAVPVDVHYEFCEDTTGEDGSLVDSEYHDVVIEYTVTTHRDPFATGDSPTEYEADPTGVAYYKATNMPFDIKRIPAEDWESLDQQAIERSRNSL